MSRVLSRGTETAGDAAVPEARRAEPQRRVLLLVGLLVAAFLVFFPTRQLVDQARRMGRLEARLTTLQAENEALQREVDRLEQPDAMELLARERLGLVKPGEQVYLFVPPEPTPAPPEVDGDGGWWLGRWWSALIELLRGRGTPAS